MKNINTENYKSNPHPDLINDDYYEMITNVIHLAALFEQIATKVINTELSFNQIKILSMIESGICTRSSEFALHFNVSKANMTGMIGRLEKNGYIVRKSCEDDYRVKILSLSEKGRTFISNTRPGFFKYIEEQMFALDLNKVVDLNKTMSNCIIGLKTKLDTK
jgi:DNA-binding MarR family transcriptional regulator